jgi:sugar phosphate isomerase/epimerase
MKATKIMIDRRTFLQGFATSMAAGLLLPRKLLAVEPDFTIGIQLYTIRDLVQKDFIGTLKILSKIGYNSAEAAGYNDRKFYGLTPKEYHLICRENGIQALSTHSNVNTGNAAKVIEDTAGGGMKYLVLPSIPKEMRQTADDYKKIADDFNLIGEKCNASGIRFGYHNHAFEFEKTEGEIPYDILLERTDPALCFMQVDFYWMVWAGHDPVEYFNRFPDRFELWHVKDMKSTDDRESTEIGKGIINFTGLFKLKDKAGMKYFFVEQELFKLDAVESINMSYQYLHNLLESNRR